MRWIVITALLVSLALQSLGPVLWRDDAAGRSVLSLFWLIGPAFGWIFGVTAFLRSRRWRGIDFIIVLYIGFLIVNSSLVGIQLGMVAAVSAFLSWGAWLGVFLWLAHERSKAQMHYNVLMVFLILLGTLLAMALIYEALSGSAFVKSTTIGDDLFRRKGFSQSVATAGIQVGCGLIAVEYFLAQAGSWKWRMVLLFFLGVQSIGLILTTARGPLLLTFICIGLYLTIGFHRNIRRYWLPIVFSLSLPIIVFPMLIQKSYLSSNIKSYIQSIGNASDVGNSVRIDRIITSFSYATSDWQVAIFGRGLGQTGVLARMYEGDEITCESSLLRFWLEGGLVGMLLYFGICLVVFLQGVKIQTSLDLQHSTGKKQQQAHLCMLLLILLVLGESVFHDMLTTWLISGIFWSNLGLLEAMNNGARQARGGKL